MDATKLIEEAGRIAAQAAKQSALDSHYSPCTCSAPPRGHTTRQHDYRRLQVDELRAVLDVVERLTAALKASEEQNKATIIGLRCAEANLKAATAETEPVKSANLAANKRIVELEHERDAARTELARLTTPQPGEPLDMDCGDNSCMFATIRGGMRTNGGCRCLESLGFRRGPHDSLRKMAAEIVSLRKRLADLTTPRPIAEAPRDGTRILAYMPSTETWMVLVWRLRQECWACPDFPHIGYYAPSHYLPLPEVKP